MSDYGNTGPLSPISSTEEADMSKVREIFERTLNAIAQATELAKQVKALSADMDRLKADFETTRDRNVELDRMLHDTREQRDRAELALREANANLSHAQQDADNYKATVDRDAVVINNLRSELDRAKKERDDYGLQQMTTQEALDKANDKLAQLHKAMGVDFKPFEVPKPEPKPEPQVVAKVTELPMHQPDPNPPQAIPVHKVFQGDPGYDFAKAHDWDDARRGWYHWSNA